MKNLCRKCIYCIAEDNAPWTHSILCEKFNDKVAPKNKCRYCTTEEEKKIYDRLKSIKKTK